MIDGNFVKSAIRIRREYLKITNSMSLYQRRAKEVANSLDDIINQLEDIKEKATKKEVTTENAIADIQKILSDVEDEGKKLETLLDPLNKELEKLGLEEQELWRQIKQKHGDIPDDDIVEFVKNKLISEGLS
jgi:predicted  nucleic acid-binding Zn-ribbon protein